MNILAKIIIAAFGWGMTAATTEETSTMFNERIINGTNINITNVPYHVALEASRDRYFCGGSIIAKNFVLTAAHCVKNLNLNWEKISIRTKSSYREEGGTTISVKNITVHPKYEIPLLGVPIFDVAVLELENPIYFDEKSQPIILTDKEPSAGEIVELTGWGWTEQEECYCKNLRSTNLTMKMKYLPTVILADSTGSNSGCKGDSGSPLTLRKRQVGVASWATTQIEPYSLCNAPNGFANLANPEIRDFIRKIAGV